MVAIQNTLGLPGPQPQDAMDIAWRDRVLPHVSRGSPIPVQRLGPSNTELLRIADRFPAPQEWYDE
jgi:hypothetical protein